MSVDQNKLQPPSGEQAIAGRNIPWFSGRNLLGVYILITLLISILTLPVAWSLAPWFYAANTSVQLKLDAPSHTQMELCWDRVQKQCLPLVPNPTSNGESAKLWLTELPPRPVYHLTVILRSPVKQSVLEGLILQPQPFAISLLGAMDIGAAYQFTPTLDVSDVENQNVELNLIGNKWYLTGPVGGQLRVVAPIMPGPTGYRVWHIAGFLWLLLIGVWLMIGGLGLPLLRQDKEGAGLHISKVGKGASVLWLIFGITTTIHLLIVINSSVQFHQFDPIDYVVFAKTLIEHGEYISLHRLPGYPMLLGMFFWVFGYHLSTVAVLQAIMFDIAVLTLALSLQPWLHPLLGAIAVFVAILSPIQVIHSVWTMSESTFATFAVFSIAALFNHLSTRGFTGKVWLIIYAISATFAFLIRPNGVVLFAALLPICLPRLLNLLYRSIGWRDKIKLFFYTVPYFMTVIVLLAAVLTWSARNYVYYNYFQLSILTGHVPLQKLLFPAIFDARGLLNLYCPIEKGCPNDLHRSLYNSFIINRYQYPHWDMTFFSMRPTIDQILPPVPGPTRQFQISQVLQAVGRKAQDLIPWQARTIGILRAGWAAFGWRNLKGAFNMTPADRATYRQRKELLHSTVSDKFVYDERGESRLVSLYTKIVSGYSWYMPLWLLALISGVLIVWRGQPALACPLFVFITNGLFYVYFLQTAEVRYIQILDTLLVFQCALGLTLLYSHNSRIRGRTL